VREKKKKKPEGGSSRFEEQKERMDGISFYVIPGKTVYHKKC
jgi:hypothetical protein